MFKIKFTEKDNIKIAIFLNIILFILFWAIKDYYTYDNLKYAIASLIMFYIDFFIPKLILITLLKKD